MGPTIANPRGEHATALQAGPDPRGGFALLTVLASALILTLVLASGFAAATGAAAEAFDHARSVQALYLAEAAAYRALAELRHRVTVDLPRNLWSASRGELTSLCRENRGWVLLGRYAGPGWTEEEDKRRAVLAIAPSNNSLRLLAADQNELGRMTAVVYVRAAQNSVAPKGRAARVCAAPEGPALYVLNFDAFVAATATVGRARRSVCLKTAGNAAPCAAWMRSADPGDGRWDSNLGWTVVIEASSPDGKLTARRWPRFRDILYDRPLWEELAD